MNPSSKVVYLTFDDGPIPQVTPQLLDILKDKNVHATFFMVGENAARFPHLLNRVRSEGHAVGNHTFNHLKGTRIQTDDYITNVAKADHVLSTRLFRPPYGRMTRTQKNKLLELGYHIYLWDVLTHDYNPHYSSDHILSIVQRYTRNGSIINFHDSLKSGDRMLNAIPQVIDYLRANGYDFAVL